MVAAEISQPMTRIMDFRTIHVKRAIAMPTMVDMMIKIAFMVYFSIAGMVMERAIVEEF